MIFMVKEIQEGEHVLYKCEECGLSYREKGTAEKCQAWCGENNSCNLEIIKFAVESADEGK